MVLKRALADLRLSRLLVIRETICPHFGKVYLSWRPFRKPEENMVSPVIYSTSYKTPPC